MEQTLGKRIVHHRKRLGLTQDQLAEKLGVTAQAVSKWENDQSCPDIAMLPRLAEIFGITTDALLGSAPEERIHQTEVVNAGEEAHNSNHFEFTLDAGRKGSLGFALLVLAVGVQLIIAKVMHHDITFWNTLWPSALLILGATGLLTKFSFAGLGCVLFGGYFILDRWQLLPFTLGGELVFPIILVVFGCSLLVDAFKKPWKPRFSVKHNGKQKDDFQISGETFEYSASFGEAEQFVSLPRLSHGKINTSFGDYRVDLSGIGEVSEHCSIDASCSFGELTLLVPRQFQVRQSSSTSFAEVSIIGHPYTDTEGIIYIKSGASFGEITISYI